MEESCCRTGDAQIPVIGQRAAILIQIHHLRAGGQLVRTGFGGEDRRSLVRLVKHGDVERIDMRLQQVRYLPPQESPAVPRYLVQDRLLRPVAVSHQVGPREAREHHWQVAQTQPSGLDQVGLYYFAYELVRTGLVRESADRPGTDHVVASINTGPGAIGFGVSIQRPPACGHTADDGGGGETMSSGLEIGYQGANAFRSARTISHPKPPQLDDRLAMVAKIRAAGRELQRLHQVAPVVTYVLRDGLRVSARNVVNEEKDASVRLRRCLDIFQNMIASALSDWI